MTADFPQSARRRLVVAIDGPAGAGKSTVARLLARRVDYTYVDTGAMYRAVALAARRRAISYEDGEALSRLAHELSFQFIPDGERPRLLMNGEDVSQELRTPAMSTGSSLVSRWPGVRTALVAHQRRFAEGGGVVMEGRDIGTVVCPGAQVKVFLTASSEERARRRAEELAARGEHVDPDRVLEEVIARDRRDTEREHSPLRPAEDSVRLVTDGLSIGQVVDRLERLIRERQAG